MRSGLFFALPFALLSGLAAHADTLSTFHFQGTSIFYGMAGDTNTVQGTVTVDATTGMVETLSFLADGSLYSGVTSQNGAEVFVGPSNAAFSFSEASLIGYTGSTFNLNGANDLYVGSVTLDPSLLSPSDPVPGVVTAAAVTPEPASLLLLSTGLLGLALVLRRTPQPALARLGL